MILYPGHNLASAGLIEPKLTARMTGRAKNAKSEIVARVHPWSPGMIEFFTLDDSNRPRAYWGTSIWIAFYSAYYTNLLF